MLQRQRLANPFPALRFIDRLCQAVSVYVVGQAIEIVDLMAMLGTKYWEHVGVCVCCEAGYETIKRLGRGSRDRGAVQRSLQTNPRLRARIEWCQVRYIS